jgi:hypothetical protein
MRGVCGSVPPNVQTVFPRVQDFKCNLPIRLGCSAAAERNHTGRFWRLAGCKLAMVHTWEPEGIFFREIKILLRHMSGEQSKEKKSIPPVHPASCDKPLLSLETDLPPVVPEKAAPTILPERHTNMPRRGAGARPAAHFSCNSISSKLH